MRCIGVVTSARSDFGHLTSLLHALLDDSEVELRVYATGLHHSPTHGHTLDEIVAEGFIDCIIEVPSFQEGDGPGTVAATIGAGVRGFGDAFTQTVPEILIVLGDRFDAIPAVLAAQSFNLPVAHISGGELSEGVIDDGFRHAITKLSHVHFPCHSEYAHRLVQMGEEPWRVHMVGHPGLDIIQDFPFQKRDRLLDEFGLYADRPITLFTYHPETLAPESPREAIEIILTASQAIDTQIVFTYPNGDPGYQPILEAILDFCDRSPHCQAHPSLGRSLFLNFLRQADCMVGNSSSGIVEAASFELPVVDIGSRQARRIAPKNVIRVPIDREAVAEAWRQALSPSFRQRLQGMCNPYGDGGTVKRIVDVLKTITLDRRLIRKHFHDLAI